MNQFQHELYWQLMMLCAEKDSPFYYTDFPITANDGSCFRVFNYRIPSFSDFQKPGALNSRGTMFFVGKNIQLCCLPMEKFFNVHEGIQTSDEELLNSELITEKVDGSLLSTYSQYDEIYLKSKGSIVSEQAVAGNYYLALNRDLHDILFECYRKGYTVNMEWVAPDNQIVVGYPEKRLVVLNARSIEDGSYMEHNIAKLIFGEHYVAHKEFSSLEDKKNFLKNIPSMEGIEGFVIRLASGRQVKYKTEWYITRHRIKDSINNPRHLFEAVVDEATDDIRELFRADKESLEKISRMERFVSHEFNSMVKEVEAFHKENKILSRKEYAILAQNHFYGNFYFPVVMNLYLNKPVDYKEFFKEHWDDLKSQWSLNELSCLDQELGLQ